MDVSRRALEMLDRERSDRELIEADLAQALGPSIGRYDAVLALDVIEHLDDDRAAIERLAVLVKPGAVLVVSVPALPEMFSAFDAIQGHRRRYLPDVLRSVFAGTGLTIERVIWWGAWLVPLLRHQRRRPLRTTPGETVSETYGRYLRLPWPARWILRVGFAWEQGRALSGKLTTGTSLFAIARSRA
jgi:SAM-dependent methyltransferase